MIATHSRPTCCTSPQLGDLDVFVRTRGNAYSLEADDICITFETSGPVAPRANEIQTFAAWAALPLGMVRNRNLFIHGVGDRETETNAAELARIWATWVPGKFRAVSLSFASRTEPKGVAAAGPDLVFYSGGVDSTFNLLRRFNERKRHVLLTIHGLDYRTPDTERFQHLLHKTQPFADHVKGVRIFARTNIYSEYRKCGINPDLGHGFALAAAAFLWDGAFAKAELAADFALHEQFCVHPWGTNSATNPLFRSGSFALTTACERVTRVQKLAALADDPVALRSLTFCVDYSARPHNCGVCTKCVRTKAMFLAATGDVPDVFRDRSWHPDLFRVFDLRKRNQLLYFLSIYHEALRNGTHVKLPGLLETHRAWAGPSFPEQIVKRVKRLVRGR